jgi:excisionase family DNA binding protein
MELLALTVTQAAELGGPCRSILYEDIRSGRLRAVKRGRSTRILMEDFRKYLAALPVFEATVGVRRPNKAQQRSGRRRHQS